MAVSNRDCRVVHWPAPTGIEAYNALMIGIFEQSIENYIRTEKVCVDPAWKQCAVHANLMRIIVNLYKQERCWFWRIHKKLPWKNKAASSKNSVVSEIYNVDDCMRALIYVCSSRVRSVRTIADASKFSLREIGINIYTRKKLRSQEKKIKREAILSALDVMFAGFEYMFLWLNQIAWTSHTIPPSAAVLVIQAGTDWHLFPSKRYEKVQALSHVDGMQTEYICIYIRCLGIVQYQSSKTSLAVSMVASALNVACTENSMLPSTFDSVLGRMSRLHFLLNK